VSTTGVHKRKKNGCLWKAYSRDQQSADVQWQHGQWVGREHWQSSASRAKRTAATPPTAPFPAPGYFPG
jgi:hypothetical protein